jgi:hypothetical protein
MTRFGSICTGVGHIAEARGAHEGRGHLGMVGVDVVRHVTLGKLNGLQHGGHLLGLLADLDHVAFLHAVGGDVHALAVHRDVAVVHELARGEDGRHELRAVDDGVETALQQADQKLTGVAALTLGVGEDAAELLLGQVAVIALQLLLGAQLQAEVGQLALAALAVLAGAVFAARDGGFRTPPDVFAHPAVDLVLGRRAFGHG